MEQCAKRLLQAILQAKPDEDGRSFKEGSVREDELSHERARPSSADEMDGMDDGIPDFVQDATNIYRTKRFIVKQRLTVAHQGMESAKLVSMDTYYLRTSKRDALYDSIFGENRDLNGKRIPAMSYFRSYRE